MKKKYFVIPLISLILSLVGILSMTLLRTSILSYISSQAFDDIDKTRKYSELWYKFNPNISSAYQTAWLYRPAFIDSTNTDEAYRKEYLNKEVIYCEKFFEIYESEYSESVEMVVSAEPQLPLDATLMPNYTLALYLSGDTEKALSSFETFYESISDEKLKKAIPTAYDFTYYVYNNSENEQDKEKLTQIINSICNRLIANHSEYSYERLFKILTTQYD